MKVLFLIYLFHVHPMGSHAVGTEDVHLGLFKLLQACHWKFLTFKGNDRIDDKIELAITHLRKSSQSMQNFEATQDSHLLNFTSVSKRLHISFTACLLHAYIKHGDNWNEIQHAMLHFKQMGEVPHHVIFFEMGQNSYKSGQLFYNYYLPFTSIRGLPVIVNHANFEEIKFMCIPCTVASLKPTFVSVNMAQAAKINDLAYYGKLINSNLLGQRIEAYLSLSGVQTLDYCDFMTRKGPPNVFVFSYQACVHFFLSTKLNYTYTGKSKVRLFKVQMNVGIRSKNFELSKTGSGYDWTAHGVLIRTFKFRAFQAVLPVSEDILFKPMEIKVWILTVAAAICVLLITKLHKKCKSLGSSDTKTKNISTIMSLLASVLDQQMSAELQKRAVHGSEMIALIWLLWSLSTIITVNGYKGLIFSFFSVGNVPTWPNNLMELAGDDTYCKFTTETTVKASNSANRTTIFNQVSLLRIALLEPTMKGTPGTDFPLEYLKLNESLKWYRFVNEVPTEIIAKNLKTKYPKYFQIYGDACDKFAFVDLNTQQNSLPLVSFMKKLISSKTDIVHGYAFINFFYAMRNFFLELFQDGVAQLEAAGLLLASADHALRWQLCQNNRDIQKKLKVEHNISVAHKMHRCLGIMTGYGSSRRVDVDIVDEYEPEPITLDQLTTPFKIFTIMILISLSLILGENYLHVLEAHFQSTLNPIPTTRLKIGTKFQ